jgi:hypothetical protein
MPDAETSARESAAELRITRVSALSDKDLIAVVTYLLAKHPDTFPPMLDDALSAVSSKAVSSKAGGGKAAGGPNSAGTDSAGEGKREW